MLVLISAKLKWYGILLFSTTFVLLIGNNYAFAASVPDAPTGVSVTAVSPTQVNLFWSTPASDGGVSISGYKIEYKIGSGAYSVLAANTGTTTTNYLHTGLTTGTAYSYKIYAINSVGTSAVSNEVSATPTSSSTGSLPDATTGLAGTAVSPTQISLSWVAPSNTGGYPITGYKIEYRVGGGSYGALVTNTASTTTTYSHTGLTTNQVYSYRVYAITSFGTSEKPSSEAIVQPKSTSAVTAPGAPTGLTATAVSPTQTNLSWSTPSNTGGYPITGYKIEYKAGSSSYSTLVANTASTTTTYSHTGLTTGTTYAYKVSAINSFGTGTASSEFSVTPTSASTASAPAPPTGLTATPVSASQVNLSWSAPSNTGGSVITGYKIEYKAGSSSYSTLVANTASTTTTYSHTGLTAGQTYIYRVSAINAVGTGNASPESSAAPTATQTAPTNTAPGAPTGLTATAVSGTQIGLSWAAPSSNGGSAITGYKIEYKAGSGSYSVLVNTVTTTYQHGGLVAGTLYSYRVSAINSIGTGSPSGEASVTPKETTTPVLTAILVSPTQVDLSWTAPSQTYKQRITGFKIEEKIGDSFRIVSDNTGGVLGYSVGGLSTGKSHTFVVSALFSAGASPRSNEVTVTPTSTSAPPPGYTKSTSTLSTSTGSDPASQSQQNELQKKIEQAREDLKKKSGKEDSEKAKAAREEAKKANEKAKQDALAARQKLIADKQAALKAQQNKTTDQTVKQKPIDATTQKPKTLEEARKLAEEAKQKALEQAQIKTTPKNGDQSKKEQEMAAAKAAAWEKAKKALEAAKAKSQK